MKATELYAMTPESVSTELGELKGLYYDRLPEIDESLWGYEDVNTEVVIKTLKDFDFDGRRCWVLRTVFFKEQPVMILQNAGRDGDDHRERFITNKPLYNEMISYIKNLISDMSGDCVLDPEVDVDYLDSFYGNSLNGKFEKY